MIKTYYWKGKKNFGDLLTPLLLQRFAQLPSQWVKVEDAQIVCVGSLIEHLPEEWGGIVAGCGKLHPTHPSTLNNATILALRGPLTSALVYRKHVRKGSIVLADPALLADELIPPQAKRYELGLVPHWTDKTLELSPTLLKYKPLIIRVSDDPLTVIKQIAQCKKIVSSSLHGIIVADACNIPRRIEIAPRMITHAHQEGGLFKWQDYSASIGMNLEIGLTQLANPNKVIELQHDLFDVFKEIKSTLSSL
jgi:pyruvyltransferase